MCRWHVRRRAPPDPGTRSPITRSIGGVQALVIAASGLDSAEADGGNDPVAFDPAQMRAAYDAGRALAKQPDSWFRSPPNVGDMPPWALRAIEETAGE